MILWTGQVSFLAHESQDLAYVGSAIFGLMRTIKVIPICHPSQLSRISLILCINSHGVISVIRASKYFLPFALTQVGVNRDKQHSVKVPCLCSHLGSVTEVVLLYEYCCISMYFYNESCLVLLLHIFIMSAGWLCLPGTEILLQNIYFIVSMFLKNPSFSSKRRIYMWSSSDTCII